MICSRIRRISLLAVIAAVLVGPSALWCQERGHCLRVEVPGLLKLPDDSVHDASLLRICFEDWKNPSKGRHVLYLDGMPWGALESRTGTDPEVKSPQPLVVFERSRYGEARLIGCAWPAQDGMRTHVLYAAGADETLLAEAADLLADDPSHFLRAAK